MLKSPTGVLVGHIFVSAAEEKIDFFGNGSRRGDSGPSPEFWREDSVRVIGTRISIEGLGKMSWRSSACTRVRYAKTIPRCRGIAFSYCTDNQRFEWQDSPVLISCCSIMIHRLLVYKL